MASLSPSPSSDVTVTPDPAPAAASSSSSPSPFTVLIIGGGPVGLTLAHALYAAHIPFTLLESRPSCTPEEGASLLAYATTQRVWAQLGLYPSMKALSQPVETRTTAYLESGKVYRTGQPGDVHRKLFGTTPWNFHRRELVQCLWDSLPEEVRQNNIRLSAKVTALTPSPTSITATCLDGTTVSASVAIGVDGVHSATRSLMRSLALSRSHPADAINPGSPYKAEYRCLWGTCPTPEGVAANHNAEAHGSERSIMFISGGKPGRSWFFLYEQMDAATDGSKRRVYGEDEMEAMAGRFKELNLLPGLKFGTIWETRTAAGMAEQLEGVVHPRWYLQGGRVVLAGDAVHRFTPNFGWGFNSGVNDVCVLASLLQKEVSGRNTPPSAEELDQVFEKYQQMRVEDDKIDELCAASGRVTRQFARPKGVGWVKTLVLWMLEHVVPLLVPNLDYKVARNVLGKFVRRGRVLDYLKEGREVRTDERLFGGELGWEFPIPVVEGEKSGGVVSEDE